MLRAFEWMSYSEFWGPLKGLRRIIERFQRICRDVKGSGSIWRLSSTRCVGSGS